MDLESLPKNNLGKEYLEHQVFAQLAEFVDFYEGISNTTMGFVGQGTKAIFNLDTNVFSSISGTVESIKNILYNGRLNDAYALLRKYYDSTIINKHLYQPLFARSFFN